MSTACSGALDAQVVGPPPPFDPELVPIAQVLAAVPPPDAYRLDNIDEMRAPVPGVEAPTDGALSRGGRYRVEERTVPDVVAPGAALSRDAVDARGAWLRRQLGR